MVRRCLNYDVKVVLTRGVWRKIKALKRKFLANFSGSRQEWTLNQSAGGQLKPRGFVAYVDEKDHKGKAQVRRVWNTMQEFFGVRKPLRGLENLKMEGCAVVERETTRNI